MKLLPFPDVNRGLALGGLLALASCGPPTWQGGIHAHLAWSHEGVRVVEVPADSPSQRADLREGDRLLSIDGQPTKGQSSEAIHKLLSGEVGSIATVEVLRGSEQLTLKISREPYDTKGVGL